MLWVFSFLSVFFYLVYFVLLLSICKLPKPSAIMGFLLALFATGSGIKERIEEANRVPVTDCESQPRVPHHRAYGFDSVYAVRLRRW